MKRILLCLALLPLGCGSGGREVVVVYSPHGADVLGDYEELFEAAHPEVDVQWLDMGSKEVYGRVRAEQGRPAGDVWWGAPSTMFTQAAAEGLLAAYKPSWAPQIDAAYHDGSDRWYATYLSPLAILFNDREYGADDVPQTWDDLLDDKWQGKVTLRKPPPSGTMRTFLCAMIDGAESEDAGFAWLERLHRATESYPESPNLLYDHLKKEPGLVSVWLQPDIVMQRQRNGFPFGYVIPKPTPVLTDGIAIIEGAPHRKWAETFYEFVTTQEALAHQAQEYAKLPARGDLDPATLPEWMRDMQIETMDIDWARFAAMEGDWLGRWEREIYGAGR